MAIFLAIPLVIGLSLFAYSVVPVKCEGVCSIQHPYRMFGELILAFAAAGYLMLYFFERRNGERA